MPGPGDFFPAQFASAILQLDQTNKLKKAEFDDQRQQRQFQEQLDQQRITLQQRAQQQQAEQAQQSLDLQSQRQNQEHQMALLQEQRLASQFGATTHMQMLQYQREEQQNQFTHQYQLGELANKQASLGETQRHDTALEAEAAKRQADEETEKRDARVQNAFSEFGKSGTAFIPETHLDEISKFTEAFGAANSGASAPYQIHQMVLPGQGVLIQKIGGPGQEKTMAEIEKINQEKYNLRNDAVLKYEQANLTAEKVHTEQQNRSLMVGKVAANEANIAEHALHLLQQQKAQQIAALNAAGDDDSLAKAKELSLRTLGDSFPEGSPEAAQARNLSLMLSAFSEGQTRGQVPRTTDVNALEAAGVKDDFFSAYKTILSRSSPGIRQSAAQANLPQPAQAQPAAREAVQRAYSFTPAPQTSARDTERFYNDETRAGSAASVIAKFKAEHPEITSPNDAPIDVRAAFQYLQTVSKLREAYR